MNDFFPKGELLAGLSEKEQFDLRTHIGVTGLVEELTNTSIVTTSLNVVSNVKLDLDSKQSGHFLKCIDSASGLAQWQPLPVYEEVFDITLDSIKDRLYTDLESLANIDVDCNIRLKSHLETPSIITNCNDSGTFKWLALESNFPSSNSLSNHVPNMLALSKLYDQSKLDDAEVLSNLIDHLDNTAGLLIASNNLAEIQDTDLALSNLGLHLKLNTVDVRAQNIVATALNGSNAQFDVANASEIIIDSNLSVSSMYTSNVTVFGEINATGISVSNVTATRLDTQSLHVESHSTFSNLIASNVETSNLILHGGDNHDVLSFMNNKAIFKKLNSSFSNSSATDIASSKAISDAVQFIDTRLQEVTNDPTFSQTYLAIAKNFSEYEFSTLDTILEIHSNLRINQLAREGTWENIQNKPVELSMLSNTYMQKDFGNMVLDDIQKTILKEKLDLMDMAFMDKSNVDIQDGNINVNKIQTENFVLNSNNNNVNTNHVNHRDEVFLYLRHAGDEGVNPSGTGKWTNLPIDQDYLSQGSNCIPSSYALSNLYKYLTHTTHISGSNIEIHYSNDSNDSNVNSSNLGESNVVITYEYFHGFLNSHFSNQTNEHQAASSKALSDMYEYLRDSNGDGYLNDDYTMYPSRSNGVSAHALAEVHDKFIDFSNFSMSAASDSTAGTEELRNFMRSSDGGLLIDEFSNQTSLSNAASSKALTDLYDYMRSPSNGFIISEFSNQTSHSNAASAKALTDLYNYLSDPQNGGFVVQGYEGHTDSTKVPSAKSLTDFYIFIRSSDPDQESFLTRGFSNQTSLSNAPTSKDLSDLYDFIRDFSYNSGFLVNDFRIPGSSDTACTSKALYDLYQYLQSSNFIENDISISSTVKVPSTLLLSNLYFNQLSHESFFTAHNRYIFEDYLIQDVADTNSNQPYSSKATSNLIQDMINRPGALFDAIWNQEGLSSEININDFTKLATAQAVYNLSNSTDVLLNNLQTDIIDSLNDPNIDLGLATRVMTPGENPITVVHQGTGKVVLDFNYDPGIFMLNDQGLFTIDYAGISNIAIDAIKITASEDDAGYSNLIEIDPRGPGEYEIKFKGTALLDEIAAQVAQSTAEAVLNYDSGDYSFSRNLTVGSNLQVSGKTILDGEVFLNSNAFFSNIECEQLSFPKSQNRWVNITCVVSTTENILLYDFVDSNNLLELSNCEMKAVAYRPFTGAHECVLLGNFNEKDIGKIVVIADSEYTDDVNSSRVYVNLCSNNEDKRCYGIVAKSISDHRICVNGLGEGCVWVCDENGNIEAGDFITSSIFKGFGQKQNSENLTNYTVAKSSKTIDFDAMEANFTNGEAKNTTFNIMFIDENGTEILHAEYKSRKAGEKARACFIPCTYHSS
tara:strand:- start:779 stop:4894 length:4116 start_codon:yes stop_codon:yes gene_type:complete